MQRVIKIDFVRFCIVGTSGFLINLLLLTLLYKRLHFELFVAQLIASEIALFSNFLLHHFWTYRGSYQQKSWSTLIVQFHASTWVAIIGSALFVSGAVALVHAPYVVALVVSSGLAMFWNFAWTRFAIWKRAAPTVSNESL